MEKIDHIEAARTAIRNTEECKRSLAAARSRIFDIVHEAVLKAGGFKFVPTGYWDGRKDLTEEEALFEAAMQESFGVDYLPDGDSFRKAGFITAVRWDPERAEVLVDGLDAMEETGGGHARFSVTLEYIEDIEQVLRFIDYLDSGLTE